MIKKKNSQGFVLVLTLVVIAFLSLIMQQLMRRISIFTHFDATATHRQQAQALALSAISLAQDELSRHLEEEKGDKKKSELEKTQSFLKTILPHMNRWQTFTLTKKRDGIDATMRICLTSENGKINLNESFDFEKGTFNPEVHDILKHILVIGKTNLGEGEFLKKLTEFLKERKKKLDDVSQLLLIKELSGAQLFYEPPEKKIKEEEIKNRPISLYDLFTVDTKSATLEPLMLSDALCYVFELKRPEANDSEKLKNQFKQIIDNFKPDLAANWTQNWHQLIPIYNKEPRSLQSIYKIFSQQFAPEVYSVISYASVSDVEIKLMAILVRQNIREESRDENKDAAPSNANKKPSTKYEIAKIYWI
jgi:hypothetical protein